MASNRGLLSARPRADALLPAGRSTVLRLGSASSPARRPRLQHVIRPATAGSTASPAREYPVKDRQPTGVKSPQFAQLACQLTLRRHAANRHEVTLVQPSFDFCPIEA